MQRRGPFGIASAQCAALVVVLLGLALRPPSFGAMVVVPLGAATQGTLVNVTLRHGGSLIGRGPLPGSLLVYGRRAPLESALWRVHAAVLAAPSSICGARTAAAAAPSAGKLAA